MGFEVRGVKKVFGKYRKKIVSTCLTTFFLVPMLVVNPDKAQAFDSKTHKFLASQGMLLLKKDKGTKAVDYLYENNGAQTIMDYSVQPDFDETDGGIGTIGGFKGHFYDPTTGTNYMDEKTDTANHRFSDHYDKAVEKYKDDCKEEAWQELGRALHYLGDLNAPHHAANLPNLESPKGIWLTHADYEWWVDRNYSKYAIKSAPKETYDYALNNSNWQIGHDMAINARDNVYLVKDFYYEMDVRNKRTATNNVLPKAQRITAGILYKFLKDVGKDDI